MKIFKRFLWVVVFFLISCSPTFAQSRLEEITNFESNIQVNTDTTTTVTEEIRYQFPELRHGIIWRIPYVYSVSAFRRPTRIDIDSVTYYQYGKPGDIQTKYSKSTSDGWLELKIGDENTEIEGSYVFEIKYTMTYTGIGYFDDHEEVYLNIIGPGWEVPIRSATATITVPDSIVDSVCYTGVEGSTEKNCKIKTQRNTLKISTTQQLQPYEGLTIAISFPTGTFEDTSKMQIMDIIIANIGILLPIPVGLLLLWFVKKKGKNEKLTVIPHYTTKKGWDPLRSGLIYSVSKNNKYVTALLIDLAVKGYLVINQYEKNKYELIKTDKSTDKLPPYILTLYNGIFENGKKVNISKLSDNFYIKVNLSFVQLSNYLKEKNILSSSRELMKSVLIIISLIVATLLFSFGIVVLINIAALGWIIGIFLSAVLIFITALKIDLRTEDIGNKEYHELLGLRLYIDTAEKHRIEFHNDPKKYNQVFETLLPYAMIFGLEKKWSKEFEEIYTSTPDWYQGDFTVFNAYYLSQALGSFNTVVATKSVPTYSSSGGYRSSGWSSGGSGFGGGSSGGGGGGSGGGSW